MKRNYIDINAKTWNAWADQQCEFSLPISHEEYIEAKNGKLAVTLTSMVTTVPSEWFPCLRGLKVLGLASGGGQQGPVFAAHGADVTIMDFSEQQLAIEKSVADREDYTIQLIQGDMTKPFPFADESYDLIFNPVSNVYVEEIQTIWKECARVIKKGGILMTAFVKEEVFMFEPDFQKEDTLISRHKLPYNPLTDLTEEELQKKITLSQPLTFSHSLTEQIGGLLKVGFQLTDLYEDGDGGGLFDEYMKSYVAMRLIKMS